MSAPLIDLRSDTVTRPTAAMKQAMCAAEVGDDMVGEDPTVNALEARCAELLGKEAAVFACSGTQSNQMAVRAHCDSGDELLIDVTGHIANYEAGGPAVLSGVTCRTVQGRFGILDVPDLEDKIRPENQHFSRTRLVCVENTTNLGGGRVYPLENLRRIYDWAHQNGLRVHMDGARFFNAVTATGCTPRDIAQWTDSVSLCFSKGLGCAMGSILVGDAPLIARARRARKLFGGALRQAGIVAAAALYALDHHVTRLQEDHTHAQRLATGISQIPYLTLDAAGVESNLVFFHVDPIIGTASQVSARLKERGILINPAGGPHRLRACTHLDVDAVAIEKTLAVLAELVSQPATLGGVSGVPVVDSTYARA